MRSKCLVSLKKNFNLKKNQSITGRKIPIALPYTGTFTRRRHTVYIRLGVILFLVLFAFLQINILNGKPHQFCSPLTSPYPYHKKISFENLADSNDLTTIDVTNDSAAAILSMVPPVLHKYLKSKSRNNTHGEKGFLFLSIY